MAASETGEGTSIDTSTDGPPKALPALKMEERTDKACRLPAAHTLSASFATDPVLRWVLTKSPTTTTTTSTALLDNPSFRDLFFTHAILPIGLAGGATILNPDGDWGCAGLVLPPGKDTESLSVYLKTFHRLLPVVLRCGFGPTWKAMISYPAIQHFLRRTAFPPSRSDHLQHLRFFYVFFLGTRHSARGRGLGGAVMKHVQSLASKYAYTDSSSFSNSNGKKHKHIGVPVYFECSLNQSRLFYEHLGFRTVCMVRVGKGEVDEEGVKMSRTQKEEGKAVGVRLWAMVWWPEGMWPEEMEGRYWDGVEEMVVK